MNIYASSQKTARLALAALVTCALAASGTGAALAPQSAKAAVTAQVTEAASSANTLDAALEKRSRAVLKKISKPSWSKSRKLKAAWKYMVSKSRWTYRIYSFSLKDKTWAKRYAYQMLGERRGDCYGFSACFAALAAEIGYKPTIVTCRVPGRRDHAADGYTRHAMVKIGKRWFDPEAQFAGWATGIYNAKSYPTGIKSAKKTSFSKFDGSIAPRGITKAAKKKKTKPVVVKKKGYWRGYKSKKRTSKITGLWCIKGKLFKFDSKGKMKTKAFAKLKAASKTGAPWEMLKAALGRPKNSTHSASCYRLGEGDDYVYKYAHVQVQTYKPHDAGPEIVLGFDAL